MQIKAHIRLKARSGTADLHKGVYISKEKPELVSGAVGEATAILSGENGHSYVWRIEYPKMLVRTTKMQDLMKYLPAIFGVHTEAKFEPKLSNDDTGFVFSSSGRFLTISPI